MEADTLFGKHLDHRQKWLRALETAPGLCPGKDPDDTLCKCPDLVYATRIRLSTGTSFSSYLYCGCCDLPIHPGSGGSAAVV